MENPLYGMYGPKFPHSLLRTRGFEIAYAVADVNGGSVHAVRTLHRLPSNESLKRQHLSDLSGQNDFDMEYGCLRSPSTPPVVRVQNLISHADAGLTFDWRDDGYPR